MIVLDNRKEMFIQKLKEINKILNDVDSLKLFDKLHGAITSCGFILSRLFFRYSDWELILSTETLNYTISSIVRHLEHSNHLIVQATFNSLSQFSRFYKISKYYIESLANNIKTFDDVIEKTFKIIKSSTENKLIETSIYFLGFVIMGDVNSSEIDPNLHSKILDFFFL